MNDEIGAREVRVVDDQGVQVGVLARAAALAYAQECGLDLVEVAADAEPPVCRVTDYGRWRYDEERRLRIGRRNQPRTAPKEVRLRPHIGPHDYEWKRNQALEFLRGRSKVKLVVRLRGRERERPDIGRELLARLASDLRAAGHLEGGESVEGPTMAIVLAPNGGSG
ncbi:MAG TPA: translation initiation factor IF-3 [Gaiellaceae bacterium]|nr:translation initiation factor IF-3 [Gaiellaceae bacterium]